MVELTSQPMSSLRPSANLNIIDESGLIELPATQASKASFPPGCNVWIYSNELVPFSNMLDGSYDAFTSSQHDCDHVVYERKVQSIFLGDVFSASRKFLY